MTSFSGLIIIRSMAYSVDETTGRPEFMSLGLAVNESIVWGVSTTGVFSDPYTKGRSYAEAFGEDLTEKGISS